MSGKAKWAINHGSQQKHLQRNRVQGEKNSPVKSNGRGRQPCPGKDSTALLFIISNNNSLKGNSSWKELLIELHAFRNVVELHLWKTTDQKHLLRDFVWLVFTVYQCNLNEVIRFRRVSLCLGMYYKRFNCKKRSPHFKLHPSQELTNIAVLLWTLSKEKA